MLPVVDETLSVSFPGSKGEPYRDTETVSCICRAIKSAFDFFKCLLKFLGHFTRIGSRAKTKQSKKIDHPEKGLCLSTNTLTTCSDGRGDTARMSSGIGSSQAGNASHKPLSFICSFLTVFLAPCDCSVFYVNGTNTEISSKSFFKQVFMYH